MEYARLGEVTAPPVPDREAQASAPPSFIRLRQKPRVSGDASSMADAWRAATAVAGADLSLAIAGTQTSHVEPTIVGIGMRGAGLERSHAVLLFSALRRQGFSRSHGDETVILEAEGLEELSGTAGLGWLAGFSAMAAVRLEGASGDRFVVAFLRRTPGELPFYEEDVRRSATILRHCAFGQRQNAQTEQSRRLLLRGLATLCVPVILTNADAKVVYANPQAEEMLQANETLARDKDGRLTTARKATTDLLHGAIRAEGPSGRDHVCSLAEPDGTRLVLTVRSLQRETGFEGGAVISALRQCDAGKARRPQLFEAVGLLKSEARFLAAISSTGTPAGAAEALGLSEETGRTYVKRILGKLGLRNQLELGRFIDSLCAPFKAFGGGSD